MNRAFPSWIASLSPAKVSAEIRRRAAAERNVARFEAYVGAPLRLPASRWAEALEILDRMTAEDWSDLPRRAAAHRDAGRAVSTLLFPSAYIDDDDAPPAGAVPPEPAPLSEPE